MGAKMSIFTMPYILESSSAQLALVLYQIAQGIENLVRKHSEAEGLSSTQLRTLLFLSNAHPIYSNIGSIARKFSITPATTTRVIDALEQKGLVERVRKEEDRRTVTVRLTEAGKKMIAKASGIGDELERFVKIISKDKQGALLEGLKQVLKAMQQEGYVTASGICKSCAFFQADAHLGQKRPHRCYLTGEYLSEEEALQEWLDWVEAQ